MNRRYVVSIIVAVASGVVLVQASNVFNSETTGQFISQGNQFLKRRDYERARQYYEAAIAREPTAWGPYLNRAVVFIRERKWDLALQDLNTVVRLKPGHLMATLLRGEINQYLGNYSRALADYDRLVTITASQLPMTCAWALNARAWLRATCPDPSYRNGKQAVSDAETACRSTACNSACIDTLAAAYAEAGDFDSAVRFQQQAMTRLRKDTSTIKDPESRRTAYQRALAVFQRRLAAYERRQPWRSNLESTSE